MASLEFAEVSDGVDTELVNEWKKVKLIELLASYERYTIFNADENWLIWLLLSYESLGYVGQSQHCAKQPKSCITVLVVANMGCTDKVPSYVIGKSMKSRCFKNGRNPVECQANKKAWMTELHSNAS